MGQSCCSHIFENTIDEMLDDMLAKTCLFSYSFFQFEVMFKKIANDLEAENLKDEEEVESKYKSLISQTLLSEEYNNLKEVSVAAFFDYYTTFNLKNSRRKSKIIEQSMIGNCIPMGIFLLGVLGFANDLNKTQLIMDLCLLLQFKLEVGSFKDLLRVYLITSINNLYDRTYYLCTKNKDTHILGFYIDNQFLNSALDSKVKIGDCVKELTISLYNESFLNICIGYFKAESPESAEVSLDEINDRKLPKEILDAFILQNPWLFCLRKLRDHIKNHIEKRGKYLEFEAARTESKE